MPGHDAIVRIGVAALGGARGWRRRANTSMTVILPPQHGHGGIGSTGSLIGVSAASGMTSSSSRASARLALRAEPASRP